MSGTFILNVDSDGLCRDIWCKNKVGQNVYPYFNQDGLVNVQNVPGLKGDSKGYSLINADHFLALLKKEHFSFPNRRVRMKTELAEGPASGFALRNAEFSGELLNYLGAKKSPNSYALGVEVIKKYKDTEMQKINTILYGPPGTGKTFNTVDLAWQILNTNDSADTARPGSIQELKSLYPGQVEFVTFHQSFSYEDFVEGIQAKSNDGKISYEIEDGVFKVLCKNAARLYSDSTASFEDALEKLKIRASEEPISCKTITGKNFWFTYQGATTFRVVPESSIQKFGTEGSEAGYPVKINQLRELFDEPDKKEGLYNSSYTKGILKFLIDEYGIKKALTQELGEKKPHVLIIDEINRGNISRIFGELITLIEPSKRAGNAEAIEVTLPYSKESFSVPNNLYIIGTMNTADRSLALMDTALRRRFDFIEMMPQPGLVTEDLEGIDVRKILAVMNQRIEALYDREHTLGHAFLMNVNSLDDLRQAFKNKILPLLEEYFYDDWQKIRWVLGASADSFYQRQRFTNLFNDTDAPSDIEKFQRKNLDYLNAQAFQAIYQGV